MTFAVVPAGGHSRRMGRPKLALPLGDGTVLERVVAALREGGADPVLVVVAPHTADLAPLAEAAGASVCQLPAATADMRATVVHGLDWLEERFHPRPDDDWLLAPADHPVLDAEVVKLLRATRAKCPGCSLFVPVWNGKRGHPILLNWRHVTAIRALPPGTGLNAYLRQQTGELLEVPAPGGGVLLDLDTPEDYERLHKSP
jgi:CTP:molybdopterin cytidylyltransferase MocA